jgi:hypothetical protein
MLYKVSIFRNESLLIIMKMFIFQLFRALQKGNLLYYNNDKRNCAFKDKNDNSGYL